MYARRVKRRVLFALGIAVFLVALLIALFLPPSCPRVPPSGPGGLNCPLDHHVTVRVVIGVAGLLLAYGLIAPAVVLMRETKRHARRELTAEGLGSRLP